MEVFLIRLLQFLLAISLLVLLHELGHFTFAKIFKVRVNKFYLFFNPKFHIASTSELYKALNLHYNIQSENGPYSIATKGFYLVTDYTGYQRMKALVKKYGRPGGGGGVG